MAQHFRNHSVAVSDRNSDPKRSVRSGGHFQPTVASRSSLQAYQAYTFYDGIPRGTEEDAAIQLTLSGFVTTLKSPVSGIVALKLELQPAGGLTLTTFRYPKKYPRKFSFRADPVPVAAWPVIHFRVRAGRTAALESHILTGKLTFQTIHFDSSLGPAQQLEIAIPITVVDHDAKVSGARWPFPHTPVGVWIALILLAPLLIALVLPIYLICAAQGNPGCG